MDHNPGSTDRNFPLGAVQAGSGCASTRRDPRLPAALKNAISLHFPSLSDSFLSDSSTAAGEDKPWAGSAMEEGMDGKREGICLRASKFCKSFLIFPMICEKKTTKNPPKTDKQTNKKPQQKMPAGVRNGGNPLLLEKETPCSLEAWEWRSCTGWKVIFRSCPARGSHTGMLLRDAGKKGRSR